MRELNLDSLVKKLGPFIESTNEKWKHIFCCPNCGDNKYRLYVNIKDGVYKCFNEDCRNLDIYETVIKPAPKLTDLKEIQIKYADETTLYNIKELSYPEYIIPPSTDAEYVFYWDYLKLRGITQKDVIDFKLMFGRKHSVYEDRIVFPVYFNEVLVYYQARTVHPNTQPRYIGSKESDSNKKSLFLYNYDNAKLCKEVVVVEGAINAIHAGKNAVACMGKYISTHQFELLVGTWSKFIISLDEDAFRYSEGLAERLMKLGKQVKVINFPVGKDIADLGKREFTELSNDSEYGVYGLLKSKLTHVMGKYNA